MVQILLLGDCHLQSYIFGIVLQRGGACLRLSIAVSLSFGLYLLNKARIPCLIDGTHRNPNQVSF